MADFEAVEFSTFDGVTLRGDFFRTDGHNRPAVVLVPGLGMLKEHAGGRIAAALRDAGYSVFAYDHRGYGSSDGAPRQQTDPLQQSEDLHDAVSAAARLPGVDASRMAVLGIGHGGGAALMAAACDPRVKTVIVSDPFISGRLDAPLYPPTQLLRAWSEREDVTACGPRQPLYLQCWPENYEQAHTIGRDSPLMHGNASLDRFRAFRADAHELRLSWENKITLQSLYRLARSEPRDHVPRVTCPLLYLVEMNGPSVVHKQIVSTAGGYAELNFTQSSYLLRDHTAGFHDALHRQVDFLRHHL
ncbi:alpha/beta hydrolase [Streptomyces sp. NPDC056227]|uniref:alpha/beta hydrolase n=1 Tax=Streptomyces sp. NPDC056227 TaxID=3345753 RepID=UPI0035DA4DA1